MYHEIVNRISLLAHEVESDVCEDAADELRDWVERWESHELICEHCKMELEDGECVNEICPECPDYEEDAEADEGEEASQEAATVTSRQR